MSVNATGGTSKVSTEYNWFQNMKAASSQKQESTNELQSKENDAVKISISQEGIEDYRKKLHESGGQAEVEKS